MRKIGGGYGIAPLALMNRRVALADVRCFKGPDFPLGITSAGAAASCDHH